MKDRAYFDTTHIKFSAMEYVTGENDEPRGLTHDEELLGELPTETMRAVLRERDVEMFIKWLRLAKPGATTLYHIGELDRDRVEDPTANLLGHIALKACELGLVSLGQRRSAWLQREYYAQRGVAPFNPGVGATLRAMLKDPPPPLILSPETKPPTVRKRKAKKS